MTDLIHIPFHEGEVLAVDIDGKPFVLLHAAFKAIGLDADQQVRKIQKRSWACTVVTTVQLPGDSQARPVVVGDVRTFAMALATIPESRVKESARPLLVAYQAEVADVIEAYWTRGGVINPRATEDQLRGIADLAGAQMAVLDAARNILPAEWLEGKARIVASRALGEAPAIDPDALPLYVEDYLRGKGLSVEQAKKVRSTFGRRLSAQYRAERGCDPEKAPGEVAGRPRSINVYYGRDRELFDAIWNVHYASAYGDALTPIPA